MSVRLQVGHFQVCISPFCSERIDPPQFCLHHHLAYVCPVARETFPSISPFCSEIIDPTQGYYQEVSNLESNFQAFNKDISEFEIF